jgi:hypothetical protein
MLEMRLKEKSKLFNKCSVSTFGKGKVGSSGDIQGLPLSTLEPPTSPLTLLQKLSNFPSHFEFIHFILLVEQFIFGCFEPGHLTHLIDQRKRLFGREKGVCPPFGWPNSPSFIWMVKHDCVMPNVGESRVYSLQGKFPIRPEKVFSTLVPPPPFDPLTRRAQTTFQTLI